jgi:hypothetical protein
VVDLLVALAQPAGLAAATAGFLIGVVVVRRGEARLHTSHSLDAVAHAEAFEAAAASELHRARRYGRPLAVISLTTRRRQDVAGLASDFRGSARINDVVGVVGKSTIAALLPETAGNEAAELVRRVANLVEDDVASGAVVGVAAFPENEVTWIGLHASAQHGARPLTEFRTLRDGPTELARDLSPSEAESPFTAPSAAHVADTAA